MRQKKMPQGLYHQPHKKAQNLRMPTLGDHTMDEKNHPNAFTKAIGMKTSQNSLSPYCKVTNNRTVRSTRVKQDFHGVQHTSSIITPFHLKVYFSCAYFARADSLDILCVHRVRADQM